MKYDEMIKTAMEMIESDDDLFIGLVDELDSYNGYADGFRCYEMYELNEFYCDKTVSDFLDDITADFNHNDEYFYYSIYGLESTNDKALLYHDNVNIGELLDNLLDNLYNIYFQADWGELEDLLKEIDELRNSDC